MTKAKLSVVLDDAGGFILPKSIRDELNLSAGDSFAVISFEEEIVLLPLRRKKLGKRLPDEKKRR